MSELSYLEKLLDGVEVEWLPLGVLGELVRGNGLPKTDFTEAGIPAIHYGQIYTFYGLSTETTKSFVSQDTAKKLKKVNTGDVVITNTSENLDDVGKALVYLGKEQAVTGGHATIFKPNKGIIGKYFAYFTQTNSFFNEKRKYSKGTKVIDVSASDMAKITIPIPCPNNPEKSLAIQSEIVRILDKFTALTAELTAELTARKKQYNYYRDQLLSFDEEQEKPIYLEKLLDGVEVEWKSLGEVAEIYGGLTGKTKADFEKGNARYISYKKIFGSLDIKNMPTDYVHVREDERQHEVRYGDILFTGSSEIAEEAGISCAVTSQFDEPVYLNSFSFGVRFNNKIKLIPEFLKYLFRTNKMRKEISKTASGVTRFNISKARFKKILIPILCPNNPEKSLAIQSEIVRILDKFDTLTNSITEGLPREIELRQKQYEYYRDLLFSFPKPDSVTN